MRFVAPCAIFASACLCLWVSTQTAQAQHHGGHGGGGGGVMHHGGAGGLSHHGGMGGGFSGHHGHSHAGSCSSFGNIGIGGFGIGGYGIGGYYPFGSYYSSYTSVGFPYASSFYYGSGIPYGGYYSPLGYPAGVYANPSYQYLPNPLAGSYAPITQPLVDARIEEEQRWAEALNFDNQIPIPIKPVAESSTQDKLRAQRLQISGDELFRKQSFSQAMRQYRQANSVAQDLPGPYYRMGVVYAIQGKFDAAVTYMKRTLELDPTWPARGDNLATLYGDDNALARNALLIEVSNWVKQDIRDPDRSFLMGVLLYDFDREQGAGFLEASARLSGSTRYVAPYLSRVPADGQNPPDGNAAPPEPAQPDHGIPMPPVPQQDRTIEPDQARPGPRIEPFPRATVDVTRPRRGQVVIPPDQPPLEGPELPLQGNNLNSPR